MEKNAQVVRDRRARSAASGDPVEPKKTRIPRPEDYGYGQAVSTAEHGEVIAYEPRLKGGRLIVPLTIQNEGDRRASYTVTVTAQGSTEWSPVTVTASNTFPGTTWPTQAEMAAEGVKNSKDVKVTLQVTKDIYPYGDSR